MKQEIENEANRVRSASERVKSFWSNVKSISGYVVLLIVMITFVAPPMTLNLIRTQIAEGEWTHLETVPADMVNLEKE